MLGCREMGRVGGFEAGKLEKIRSFLVLKSSSSRSFQLTSLYAFKLSSLRASELSSLQASSR